MRDGDLAHFIRDVPDVLSNTYHDRWICRGGPTAWPPQSRDLNPLHFYMWGHLQILVNAAPVEDKRHYRIVDACQTIRNYPSSLNMNRLRPFKHWDRRFESHLTHECLFAFILCLCCPVSR
jgi:hypothetical protein